MLRQDATAVAARAGRCRTQDRQWRPAVQPARPVFVRPERRQSSPTPTPTPDRQRRRHASRRRSRAAAMAACSVRAAASTSGFKEIVMATRCNHADAARFGARDRLCASSSGSSGSTTTTGIAGQFPDLPDAADDAAAEPEPARSARHQPVHRSSSCNSPASSSSSRPNDQLKSLDRSGEERAGDPGAGLRRQDRRRRRQHRASSTTPATWNFSVAEGHRTPRSRSPIRRGQTVYTGNYNAERRATPVFVWDGKGNDGTQWPAGNYKMTATAKDSSRQQRGDLHRSPGRGRFGRSHRRSPPLLSIGGQNYTIDQIKRVRPTRANGRSRCEQSARRRSVIVRTHSDPVLQITRPPGIISDAGPRPLRGIFKEIRIEALGLGKF